MSIEIIVFYLLLIDSTSSVLVSFFGEQWYIKHFRIFSRFFPPAKGWSLYYLALVLWVGTLLLRLVGISVY